MIDEQAKHLDGKKGHMSRALPETLKKYFWDCDFRDISMENIPFSLLREFSISETWLL